VAATVHVPVLLEPVVQWLAPRPGMDAADAVRSMSCRSEAFDDAVRQSPIECPYTFFSHTLLRQHQPNQLCHTSKVLQPRVAHMGIGEAQAAELSQPLDVCQPSVCHFGRGKF
jgi:hypothetical protein